MDWSLSLLENLCPGRIEQSSEPDSPRPPSEKGLNMKSQDSELHKTTNSFEGLECLRVKFLMFRQVPPHHRELESNQLIGGGRLVGGWVT